MQVFLEFCNLKEQHLDLFKNLESILGELGYKIEKKYDPNRVSRIWRIDSSDENPINIYVSDADENEDLESSIDFFDESSEIDSVSELQNQNVFLNDIDENDVNQYLSENEEQTIRNEGEQLIHNIANQIYNSFLEANEESEEEFEKMREEYINKLQDTITSNKSKKYKLEQSLKLLSEFIDDDQITDLIDSII